MRASGSRSPARPRPALARCRAPRRAPTPPLAASSQSSGRDRHRSGDLALFRRALYQLSYPTSQLSLPRQSDAHLAAAAERT